VELVLITHSSEKEIAEIRDFGHTTEETASKIENVWQEIIQDYLPLLLTADFFVQKTAAISFI